MSTKVCLVALQNWTRKRMYSRERYFVPGMLARTPIVLGEDGVSQRFTVAQRFLTGFAGAGAGSTSSATAASQRQEQASTGAHPAPS